MTNAKFIELLNLYLDGGLSPDEAAVLEQEIRGNADRHRIYRQYCQMQNACAELSERFRDEAVPAPHFRAGNVVEIPRRAANDWLRSFGLIASGAVAACAVFVAVRVAMPGESAVEANTAQPTAAPVLATAQPVPFTTAVSLNANPAGFHNPWASNRDFVYRGLLDPNQIASLDAAPLIAVPEMKLNQGAATDTGTLQPYGKAPGATLRMEEIEAAAFQFQR